jgi:uncharacterized protein (DUF697 family)/predicted GTPase
MEALNLGQAVRKALEEALRERGHANVLIAGRTGVGKSTLINSIFQENFAATGHGRPVTMHTREIRKDDLPISVFDTRGLEMQDFPATLAALKTFIEERARKSDPREHIHVAWVCIAEDLRRVEEAESALVTMLADRVPVLAVVTKARADQGFRAEVQQLLPRAANVLRVRAIPERLDDGHQLEPMGLRELVEATVELIPETQQRAFVAAQKANLALKAKLSHVIVGTAAASAAAIGMTPIPFADAALLVPAQIAMLAGITATFGLPLAEGFPTTLVASAVGGGAATLSGRAIVAAGMKLIPGAGTVAGGVISGAAAAMVTTTLGEAYISVLERLFVEHHGEAPTPEEVLTAMRHEMQAT